MMLDKPVNAVYRALDQRGALGALPSDQRRVVFQEVSKRFPGLDWSTFLETLDIVAALRRSAYELADQARETGRNSADVARELAERFPGLDHDVLDRAVSTGFFESR